MYNKVADSGELSLSRLLGPKNTVANSNSVLCWFGTMKEPQGRHASLAYLMWSEFISPELYISN